MLLLITGKPNPQRKSDLMPILTFGSCQTSRWSLSLKAFLAPIQADPMLQPIF